MIRALLWAFALAGVALPWAVQAQQPAPEPFRLGVMGDHGGANVDTSGPRTVYAVQMAVDDFGGKVLGRRIEILQADFGGKTDIAASKVREWFDLANVQAVLDGPTSTAGIAIQGLAQERNRVYLNSSASSSDFTGKLCTPTAVPIHHGFLRERERDGPRPDVGEARAMVFHNGRPGVRLVCRA